METTKDALEFLVESGKKLAPIQQMEFRGRSYTNREIKPVEDPQLAALQISTLSSLLDLVNGRWHIGSGEPPTLAGFEAFDGKLHLVHVVSEKQVNVVSAVSDAWGRREHLVNCTLTETTGFQFGKFLSQEQFIIGLLTCFAESEERQQMLQVVGNLTAERVATLVDDGISQAVAVRAGAAMKDQVTLRRLVNLQPFRTFREIDQPASPFIIRASGGGEANIPSIALFEADGGGWRLAATEQIARFLRAGLKDVQVVS